MRTIKVIFMSEGVEVRKTAVLTDDLAGLSRSKRNEATDILEPGETEENTWALFFAVSDNSGYELQFQYNMEQNRKTILPVKAITWGGKENCIITDVQKFSVKI